MLNVVQEGTRALTGGGFAVSLVFLETQDALIVTAGYLERSGRRTRGVSEGTSAIHNRG